MQTLSAPSVGRDAIATTGRTAPPPDGSASLLARIDRERLLLIGSAAATWLLLVVAFALGQWSIVGQPVIVGVFVVAYLTGGTLATVAAVRDLLGRSVNVDLLMVTAALGAATLGAWAEGTVLLALFATSNALEHEALGRTERAVRALISLSPATATVLHGDQETETAVERLAVGDVVLVRPGERVAADGTVVAGHSAIDEATITGESLPVDKVIGATVYAGTINTTGVLRVRVTAAAGDSTLARIVRVVERAQADKSRTQRFADAFEGRYAVGVIAVSAAFAVVPPTVVGVDWGDAFYRAMTLLVVASPCALVISTPAAILSALANGARRGMLFKGGSAVEDAAAITTVAFDKTGTLTLGTPKLTDMVPEFGWTHDELIAIAAAVERGSEHPISRAIVNDAADRSLATTTAEDVQAQPGLGIAGTVLIARDGPGRLQRVAVGTPDLMASLGIAVPVAVMATVDRFHGEGRTAILVAVAGTVIGVLAVADVVRSEAAAAVAALRRAGVRRTVMLTGDNEQVAWAIARQVGIDEVHAGLLPEEKLDRIRSLQADGQRVAMVGDGVNDAPALATADLGIAMGGGGTDVALETADVVLMSDDLRRVSSAIRLGRRARRTMMQNLTFALGVIAVLVTSTVLVGIPLPIGVVGHEGSTVLVVLNGLRLLTVRNE